MKWIPITKKLPPENTEIIYCTRYGVKFGYLSGYVWYYYDMEGYEKVYFEHDKVVAWMPKPGLYEETTD